MAVRKGVGLVSVSDQAGNRRNVFLALQARPDLKPDLVVRASTARPRSSLHVPGTIDMSLGPASKGTTDTTPFAATGPLVIGRQQYDGLLDGWFNGAANQIQVWNVALTSAEVANIPM